MKTSDTSKDFERIQELEHIDLIEKDIKLNFKNYFEKVTQRHIKDGLKTNNDEKFAWATLIEKHLGDFRKESQKYEKFFSEENLYDYEEMGDAKGFKSALRNECPIIHKTLFSKMEELQKWKEDFAHCKPQEIFDIVLNFIDFGNEYAEKNQEVNYNNYTTIEGFDEVSELTEEEDFVLRNVIGAGIRTTILYNLHPSHFCKSVRRTLYGLSFLTPNLHEKTPSRTSEFIMIDDKVSKAGQRNSSFNMRMEHNYWYPYNLFMHYCNLLFILLDKELKSLGIILDNNFRYVYVNMFLEEICAENAEYVKTMMGGDQDA